MTHPAPGTEGILKGGEEDILHLQAEANLVHPATKSLKNLIKKMKSEIESGNTTLSGGAMRPR